MPWEEDRGAKHRAGGGGREGGGGGGGEGGGEGGGGVGGGGGGGGGEDRLWAPCPGCMLLPGNKARALGRKIQQNDLQGKSIPIAASIWNQRD